MKKFARIFVILYLVNAVLGASVGVYLGLTYPNQVRALFAQATAKIERALDVTH